MPKTLHKPIFAVRLQPLTGRDITSEWQRCDLFGDGPKTSIPVGGESRAGRVPHRRAAAAA